jgi:hypothetical protein
MVTPAGKARERYMRLPSSLSSNPWLGSPTVPTPMIRGAVGSLTSMAVSPPPAREEAQ